MAKRPNAVYKRTKSKHSPKTKKRLAIKRAMLTTRAAKKRK